MIKGFIQKINNYRLKEGKYIGLNLDIVKLTAKHAMIKPVFIFEDDEAKTIIKKLKKENTNVCIVINHNYEFIGKISNEDLIKFFLSQVKYEPLTKLLNHGYRREFINKSAINLINKYNISVNLDTPINEVIKKMHKENYNYLPVVDNNKKVIGVVTPSSILDLLEYR